MNMDGTMTTQELADLFGYNLRRIQQLTKEGIIVQQSRNCYVLADVVKGLIKLNLELSDTIRQKNEQITALETEKPKTENPESDFDTLVSELCAKEFKDYTKGDLEKMKHLVDIRDRNMRFQERQGQLVRADEVADAAAEVAGRVRDRLYQMVFKLTPALAATINENEVETALSDEIEAILKDLSV